MVPVKKKIEKKQFLRDLKSNYISLSPPATHEYPQKISAHSVQPFGRQREHIYECLFYYIGYILNLIALNLINFFSLFNFLQDTMKKGEK